MRLIDADELIKNWYDDYIKFMTREEIESMNGIIENAPTINAVPIPKGATGEQENEAVLDKISREIEDMDFDFGDYYDHTDRIREMVLEVVNKYKEGEADDE